MYSVISSFDIFIATSVTAVLFALQVVYPNSRKPANNRPLGHTKNALVIFVMMEVCFLGIASSMAFADSFNSFREVSLTYAALTFINIALSYFHVPRGNTLG